MTSHRDASTGQYVTAEHAAANPDTTVSEQRTRRPASDYSELRKLAEACPPEDTNSRWYSEDQLAQVIELAPVIVDEDRPFVAACTPTRVLGLLDELDRLRGVNHTLQVALDGANARITELEANLDHLRTEDIPVIQRRRNSNSKPQLGVGLEPIAFDPPLTDDESGAFLDAITADEAEPIVRTVGDLTARHIGKRVRVGDGAGAIEGRLLNIEHDKRTTDVAIAEGDQDVADWWPAGPHDTPCEVLP